MAVQGAHEVPGGVVPHRLEPNPGADRKAFYGSDQRHILNMSSQAFASETVTAFPGYEVTPLLPLSSLAEEIGVDHIWYKDESSRFGIGSFKALGTAFAVYRVLAAEIFRFKGIDHICVRELLGGRFRDIVSPVTLTCATDGNHGRSVAWAAQLFNCGCVIYVHESVSESRIKAIKAYGAEVVRVPGTYDDAMRRCGRDCQEHGYALISDKATDRYWEVPRDIMQGYSIMMEEVLGQLPPGQRPTHVFVQSGVGGLAGALCGHLWEVFGRTRPRFTVVEPERADCVYQSGLSGTITAASGNLETVMAGLSCGEMSPVAWQILEKGVDYWLTIPDDSIASVMRMLAEGHANGEPIVAGETGVAGLAGLLAVASKEESMRLMKIDEFSRILVVGTEGATDPQIYQEMVGYTPEEVANGAAIPQNAQTARS